MADIADQADDHITKELELAIRAARGVMPPDTRSAECCEVCKEEISSARQNAVQGCVMCKDCAEEWENRIRRGL